MSPTSVVSALALCSLMKVVRPITELPPKPSWVSQAEFMSVGSIRVPKSELDARYVNFAIMPQSLFFATADHLGYIEVPAKKIASMEKKLVSEVAKQKALTECADRNNRGKELEKDGRLDEAVALYEDNIKPGCWPATYSFDRLLVIYHKRQDYKNELRVCRRAVSVFKKIDKYKARLEKIITLMSKK